MNRARAFIDEARRAVGRLTQGAGRDHAIFVEEALNAIVRALDELDKRHDAIERALELLERK
jgi:hypothetical protein